MPEVKTAIAALRVSIVRILSLRATKVAFEICLTDAVGVSVIRQERVMSAKTMLSGKEKPIIVRICPIVGLSNARIKGASHRVF